jgi:(S)-3,5-dihydroxyphenylglycine transaminase
VDAFSRRRLSRGPAGRERTVPLLDRSDLHPSLADPVLGAVGFLNEVMGRFPDAISFAPGAPNLAFVRDLDIARCVETYLDHLTRDRGLGRERAFRLLSEYGPSQGLINDLVAAALRVDYGIAVEPASVVITVGAQEAMLLVLRALCARRTDMLAVVTPCFVGITGAARLLDIPVVPVPEAAGGIDLDRLAAACQAARRHGGRVRACYLAPDFANPSGTVLDLAERERLLDLAEREDLLLIEDSAYGFTAAPGAELPPLKALDRVGRVIYLGTFAKICLPGARVGFAVADQVVRTGDGTTRLAGELAAIKGMVTVNTSPICQAVIGGMLLEHGGSLAALGRARCALYRRNLALLLAALDRRAAGAVPAGVTWNRPTGGFFVRMRLPVPADPDLLELSASRYGVLWTPMSHFHLDGTGDDEIRLSCSYLEPGQIEEGVSRLTRLLAALPDRSPLPLPSSCP